MKSVVHVCISFLAIGCLSNVVADDVTTKYGNCFNHSVNTSGSTDLSDDLIRKAKGELKLIVAGISLFEPLDIDTICNISRRITSKLIPLYYTTSAFSAVNSTNRSVVPLHVYYTTPTFSSFNSTNRSRVPPQFQNMFFISIQLLTNSILTIRKDDCENNNGIYVEKLGFCVLNSGNQYVTYCITITGYVISSACLLTLLVTYFWLRELQTLPGMILTRMSIVLLITFLMEIMSLYVKKRSSVCSVLAVFLHLSHLTSFVWMAAISLDLFLTFNFPGQLSLDTKNRRYLLYNYVSFGSPMVLVLLCVLLEYTGGNLIGYGAGGVCFVVNLWANLFAVVVPIGIILVFNTFCLVCAIRKIYLTEKRIHYILSKTKSKLHFVIMTLKVSTLTGLGWILRLIASATRSPTLIYIALFLTSYQGVFIFIGFVCTKRIFKLYKEKFASFR